ncbi:hypothetical protein ZWY2020_055329 [Hordeum vulgare]|nr:hypothetical protein ZWY2020_055329 [Hordeum vulgare]
MLHQTLIPSSPLPLPLAFSASASSDPPLLFAPAANPAAAAAAAAAPLRSSAMPSYAHHHSSLDERMDALKGSGRHEETADEVAAADATPAWGFAERDGFSVEDLLDLEEFCEPDKDAADEPEEAPPAAAAKEDKLNGGPRASAVSYELVPPAPPAPEIVDLPAHDVEEELEWVSRIMDDSLSELPPQPAPPASMMAARPPQHRLLPQRRPQDGAYRALPSMSDPMRTPTICALSTEALVPIKAKRSKRSRASGWSLSGPTPDSTSSSSTTTTSSCSSSASFSPYFLLDSPQFGASELMGEYNILPPPAPKKSKHGKSSKNKPKKRGRKPKNLPAHPPSGAEAAATQSDRRCSHCGVQKTPQWRAGPEGAKTLCNACGVRYKSGRLLPEYRPACSPTYVSSVHSNSHRKVLEMRRKKEDGPLAVTATAPAVASF